VWIGEGGVRLYAAGSLGALGRIIFCTKPKLALDDDLRLKVVRQMYKMRSARNRRQRRSVEQLRGIEGARVRAIYQQLARSTTAWSGSAATTTTRVESGDIPNRCLSRRNGLPSMAFTEAAVLAAGYAPAIGFIHTGKPLSSSTTSRTWSSSKPWSGGLSNRSFTPGKPRAGRAPCLSRCLPHNEDPRPSDSPHRRYAVCWCIDLPLRRPSRFRRPSPNPRSLGDAGHRT